MILQLIAVNRRAFPDFVLDLVFPEGPLQKAEKRSNAQNMQIKCLHARKVNDIENMSLKYHNYNTSDAFYLE